MLPLSESTRLSKGQPHVELLSHCWLWFPACQYSPRPEGKLSSVRRGLCRYYSITFRNSTQHRTEHTGANCLTTDSEPHWERTKGHPMCWSKQALACAELQPRGLSLSVVTAQHSQGTAIWGQPLGILKGSTSFSSENILESSVPRVQRIHMNQRTHALLSFPWSLSNPALFSCLTLSGVENLSG